GVLKHFGTVRFFDAAGDRGTIVYVHLEYVPVGGSLGTAIASVSGRSPQQLVREALQRLKQLFETGEIPTNADQPAGAGRSPVAKLLQREQTPAVLRAGSDD